MTTDAPAVLHPLVSVIIRNLNEAQLLRDLLEVLRHQSGVELDAVVVDNESSDDSRLVAESGGARVVSISREQFTYGRALNVGLSHARGEVCVLLSAHSLPLGPSFLKECARALEDPSIAAARCVHVGKPRDLLKWTTPETLTQGVPPAELVSKGPLANGCAIRRSAWELEPFPEAAVAAEEKIWTHEILRRGHKVTSVIPAFYLYRKVLDGVQLARRDHKEALAVWMAFGIPSPALTFSWHQLLRRVASHLIVSIPRFSIDLLRRDFEAIRLAWRTRRSLLQDRRNSI